MNWISTTNIGAMYDEINITASDYTLYLQIEERHT
jgi:hypothetical protein